ncbi:MAG: branched-chain-amino-acid transaminase [Bacillota bacterium]
MKVYLDGRLVDEKDAVVSVFDHSFLYGDGVFEGIRAYGGRVFRLDAHLDRLYDSAKAIELTIPLTKAEFKEAVLATLRGNGLSDAYIRPVISRGAGALGIDPANSKKPTVVIIASTIKVYPEEFYQTGLKVATSSLRRNIPDALSPRIKSCNYLNNILAKLEAKRMGVAEALFLDRNGYVTECTADNVFIVRKGEVITPPTYVGALKGITRDVSMEAARHLGHKVREDVFTVFDVFTADECFLTGTAVEVAPVVLVDGKSVGDGRPGPVTMAIRKRFREMTGEEGTPINA